MGRAVASHNPGPVDGEHHRQVLQADIMKNLIIGTLKERRIDGEDRPEPLAGKPCCKSDAVLLGNPDIEKPLGEFGGKTGQPRTIGHCCSYGYNPFVLCCDLLHRLAKKCCIGSCASLTFQYTPGCGIKGSHAVEK